MDLQLKGKLALVSGSTAGIGLATVTVLVARSMHMLWIAIPIFAALAAIAAAAYVLVLSRIDGMAIGQRESLIDALCRS